MAEQNTNYKLMRERLTSTKALGQEIELLKKESKKNLLRLNNEQERLKERHQRLLKSARSFESHLHKRKDPLPSIRLGKSRDYSVERDKIKMVQSSRISPQIRAECGDTKRASSLPDIFKDLHLNPSFIGEDTNAQASYTEDLISVKPLSQLWKESVSSQAARDTPPAHAQYGGVAPAGRPPAVVDLELRRASDGCVESYQAKDRALRFFQSSGHSKRRGSAIESASTQRPGDKSRDADAMLETELPDTKSSTEAALEVLKRSRPTVQSGFGVIRQGWVSSFLAERTSTPVVSENISLQDELEGIESTLQSTAAPPSPAALTE